MIVCSSLLLGVVSSVILTAISFAPATFQLLVYPSYPADSRDFPGCGEPLLPTPDAQMAQTRPYLGCCTPQGAAFAGAHTHVCAAKVVLAAACV